MNGLRSLTGTGRRFPPVARLIVPLLGVFFLVYPVQIMLRSDPAPALALFALGGAALFAGVLLWLMWTREPLQLTLSQPSEVFNVSTAIPVLAVLAGLLGFGVGPEWRMLFFYHLNVAAGIMLPKRDAYVAVAGITLLTVVVGLFSGFLAAPAAAIGLWSIAFVGQVASEERLRFARDLHDLLGHSLSLLALKSELVERLIPKCPENERAVGGLRDLRGVARGALEEVREAVSGYRRPSLGEELAGACAMLEAAGISCLTQSETGELPKEAEPTLTWVVREGVTNVVRHSRAKRCEIRLSRDGENVHAEVEDDGPGPRPKDRADGSGLSGLAERVEASRGRLEAGPGREGGFVLRVILPSGDDRAGTGDRTRPEVGAPGEAG